MRGLPALIALGLALPVLADGGALTLDQVLAHVGQPHPELAVAQAQVDLARAEQLVAESQDDFRVTLEATLSRGRNKLTDDRFEPDDYARLSARKTLWDAGRTSLGSEAAGLEAEGRVMQVRSVQCQRRLALMTRFFDVLLTDLQYAADNEFMAVAYVNWDNGRDRHQVGELSSVGLAELEARYNEWRIRRNDDLRRAREKRAQLAAAMNRPGELPSELVDPELKGNDRPVPEFKDLLEVMLEHNPRLLAQRQSLEASRKRMDAQRAEGLPSLEFEAGIASYNRETLTRDDVRYGLNLNWPLYQGKRVDARLAREQAQLQVLQAQHDALVLELRQALFEAREEILHLRDNERRAAEINAVYRDWSLERARAEYELELKTNLGNGMAETQAARARKRAVEYRLALAWARLEALIGKPVRAVTTEEQTL